MIDAKIILDSDNGHGNRLTTFELTYPRFIHAELMTHRQFSRNAASSRAIPIHKFIKQVRDNPAMPVHWGKNQRGMQAFEEVPEETQEQAKGIWVQAMNEAIQSAERLLELGIHKQVANRLMEPFFHMRTIVTATEYENFFSLRAHPDAQPEIQALGYAMLEAYEKSEPVERRLHAPYIRDDERLLILQGHDVDTLRNISVARCARVSYLTHDGKRDFHKDITLYERLRSANPPHMSPFEHVATPTGKNEPSGNFRGWLQYRKVLEKEL